MRLTLARIFLRDASPARSRQAAQFVALYPRGAPPSIEVLARLAAHEFDVISLLHLLPVPLLRGWLHAVAGADAPRYIAESATLLEAAETAATDAEENAWTAAAEAASDGRPDVPDGVWQAAGDSAATAEEGRQLALLTGALEDAREHTAAGARTRVRSGSKSSYGLHRGRGTGRGSAGAVRGGAVPARGRADVRHCEHDGPPCVCAGGGCPDDEINDPRR